MKSLIVLLMLFPAFAYGESSLCNVDEQVLFSCSTGKVGKLVSLCGSKKLSKNVGYLQYRYGRLENIELKYPLVNAGSLKKFKYAHYLRYQIDRTLVSFSNDEFEYSIFTSYNGEEKPPMQKDGILVSKKGQLDKETRLLCKPLASVGLRKLENVLPCDIESALASCDE